MGENQKAGPALPDTQGHLSLLIQELEEQPQAKHTEISGGGLECLPMSRKAQGTFHKLTCEAIPQRGESTVLTSWAQISYMEPIYGHESTHQTTVWAVEINKSSLRLMEHGFLHGCTFTGEGLQAGSGIHKKKVVYLPKVFSHPSNRFVHHTQGKLSLLSKPVGDVAVVLLNPSHPKGKEWHRLDITALLIYINRTMVFRQSDCLSWTTKQRQMSVKIHRLYWVQQCIRKTYEMKGLTHLVKVMVQFTRAAATMAVFFTGAIVDEICSVALGIILHLCETLRNRSVLVIRGSI